MINPRAWAALLDQFSTVQSQKKFIDSWTRLSTSHPRFPGISFIKRYWNYFFKTFTEYFNKNTINNTASLFWIHFFILFFYFKHI